MSIPQNQIIEKERYPKVLIFGEGFRDMSGPGLTLTSLFKGWPSDRIADAHSSIERSDEVTTNHIYPPMRGITSVWRKQKKSLKPKATKPVSVVKEKTNITESKTKIILRTLLADKLFWYRDGASETLKQIKAFEPDILYVQPSFGNSMAILRLHDYLDGIAMISHVMDDWPGQWSQSPNMLERLLTLPETNAFKRILQRSQKKMTICQAMSNEYETRYGGGFVAFQRLIDIDPPKPIKIGLGKKIKLLYVGRVGVAVTENLKLVSKAVEQLSYQDIYIEFVIVTAHKQKAEELGLGKYLDENAPYLSKDIPSVIRSADILLLPLDFSPQSLRFSRLSMPSKVPEYLCSEKPCLVFASEKTALAQYALENEWGKVVTTNSIEAVTIALKELLNSPEERFDIVTAAIHTYNENHSPGKRRALFQEEVRSIVIPVDIGN